MDSKSSSHYLVASCSPAMYLFQLDSWREAFPRHWHEEWGFAVIQQGINRFWFRGAWHNAGPGSIVVVPPGEVHDGGLDKDSVWGERMCYVPVESMARITEAATGRSQAPRFSTPIIRDRLLARLLLRLHRTLSRSEEALEPLEASECQVTCLGPLLERYGNAPQMDSGKAVPARIRRVLELFHDDLAVRLTLEEVAAVACLSPCHLIRAFKKHVGLPPHAYLKQLRITRAQGLLRRGSSIANAALATGFADQSHLTREFRRSLGVTPRRFTATRPRRPQE